MKKLLLAFSFLCSACVVHQPVQPVPSPSPIVWTSPTPSPSVSVSPSPVPSPKPSVVPSPKPSPKPTATGLSAPQISLGTENSASPDELKMIQDGAALVNQVMKTSCFKQAVLNSSYAEVNGMTPAQIWATLLSKPVIVNVDMYTGSWWANHVDRTIGYEVDPGTVHMNRYFVTTAYMVADNLAHEGEGHSQGFTHLVVATKYQSEPYGMNTAFEQCSTK